MKQVQPRCASAKLHQNTPLFDCRTVFSAQQISMPNLHRPKKAWTLELEKDGNITNKQKRVIIISISVK